MRHALLAVLIAGAAAAHDGVEHKTAEEAARHLAETRGDAPPLPDTALPLPGNIGGPFALIDQTGAERTETDPDGHHQLLFFGYANCVAICDTALPRMAEVTDMLAAEGHTLTPILVTVDPERDTVTALAEAVPERHPRMVGLTGSEADLAALRDAYQIEAKPVFEDPQYGTIYSHGSFIYVLDPQGAFLTLLPPILGPERMAEIVASYL
ncbi:SCO family protein [Pontivivens ytuae]|uniref:SCO family protein n=1 Tax=Pontivivens ytuae TaxID=2789856 RepID=A0A7S9LSP7_9RHOB|nr:SCO family protein [Pontivivens ytuae]QPH54587.1 SCO family protein [Pontivivens ytuae]